MPQPAAGTSENRFAKFSDVPASGCGILVFFCLGLLNCGYILSVKMF
jgi:hypothetical protein